jgi:hypothetical protein
MRPPTMTEEDEAREKHCQSWLGLSVPVPGPAKAATSCSKDGELHSGWTTVVLFLAGEQMLSPHYHTKENSVAQGSVQ